MRFRVRNALCAVIGTALLLGAASLTSAESTREAEIREKSIGTGVADKAIEEDRANRNSVSDHSEVGNTTNFLNNLNARVKQRAASSRADEEAASKAANAREAQQEKELINIESTYLALKVSTSQMYDILGRMPLDKKDPKASEKAFALLEYCIKRYGLDAKYPTAMEYMPCYLTRAKAGSGLMGREVYDPDPKKALKLLKWIIKEEPDLLKKRDLIVVFKPEALYYIGELYFQGMDYPKSRIKQDFGEARDYFEQSIKHNKGDSLEYGENHVEVEAFVPPFVVDSYFRLIEIYSLGVGTNKDPARAQALAQELVSRTDGTGKDFVDRPEWNQVKPLITPYLKKK